MYGSNPLLLPEEPCVCDFSLQLMSYYARDVSSDSTVSLPPLLLLFFLYILSCRSMYFETSLLGSCAFRIILSSDELVLLCL